MDEYGLPVLGPSVDYTKAAPLDTKRLQSMVNEFLVQSTSFLNAFSSRCEQELAKVEANLQRVDTTLLILENKLESIGDVGQPAAPPTNDPALQNKESVSVSTVSAASIPDQIVVQPAAAPVQQIVAPTTSNIISVSRDPAFSRFFKMLQFGVPPPAVKTKMISEGVAPELLDDPNAPTPNGLTESDLEALLQQADDESDDD